MTTRTKVRCPSSGTLNYTSPTDNGLSALCSDCNQWVGLTSATRVPSLYPHTYKLPNPKRAPARRWRPFRGNGYRPSIAI